MHVGHWIGLGFIVAALSACGHTTEQKASTGGLGGAAAGAVVGGPVGAVVGGIAGAGGGAAVEKEQENEAKAPPAPQ